MINEFDCDWLGIKEWITKTGSSFSLITSALAAILDPEAIVLGGRMPRKLARLVIPYIDMYNDSRRGKPRALPRLLIAKAGGDASAIGAALTSRRWLESGDRPQIGAIAADDSCGVTLNDRRFPTC
ncbi:MAG: hypothetical protein ACNYPE_01185 [Candidatus Azotimanducaceae bacterium WSBS_2022_MAG_OTU7]